jgi:hypothetical protein
MPSQSSPVDILIKVQKDTGAIKETTDELRSLQKDAGKLSGMFKTGLGLAVGTTVFGSAQKALASLASVIRASVSAGFEHAKAIQEQTIAFGHLMGSAEEATARVKELADLARNTPFAFNSLIAASRNLQLLTNGALAGEKGLTLIGDAATAAGVPIEHVAQVVGVLHEKLKIGDAVERETNQLFKLGLVSAETKARLDGLGKAGIVGGAAWSEAETALSKFAGAMDRQGDTWAGLMGEVSASWRELWSGMFGGDANAITGMMRAFFEGVGLAQSRELKKIEQQAKTHAEKMKEITTGSLTATRDDTFNDLKTKRAELEELRESIKNVTAAGGSELYDTYQKAGALAKSVEALEDAALQFDGGAAVVFGKTREQIAGEIAALNDLSETLVKKRETVFQDGPFGTTAARAVESEHPRGLTAEEQTRRAGLTSQLTRIDSAAPAADRAAANDERNTVLAQEEADAARVAQAYKSIAEVQDKLAAGAAQAAAATEWENASFGDRLAILDREAAASAAVRDERLATAALSTDATKREAIESAARNQYEIESYDIEKRRAAIKKQHLDEAQAAADKNLATKRQAAQLEENDLTAALKRLDTERQTLVLRTDIAPAQKQDELNKLATRHRDLLEELVALKQRQLDLTDSPLEKQQLQNQITNTEDQLAGVSAAYAPAPGRSERAASDYASFSSGASPDTMTMGEGMFAGMQEWVVSLGSTGEQVAASMQATLGTALDSISTQITGLITGTQTWGQALRNIGSSIINQVIQSIIKMFVTWMTQKVAMAVLDTALNKKSKQESSEKIALNAVEGGTKAVAQMGPWGALAFIAALAVIMAAATAMTGGFAEGGYTGPGAKYDVAGAVHAGEFVLPADVVDRVGVDSLYGMMGAIRAGEPAPAPAAYAAPAAAAAPNVDMSMQLHLDPDAALAAALRSPASQRMIVDLVRQNRSYI